MMGHNQAYDELCRLLLQKMRNPDPAADRAEEEALRLMRTSWTADALLSTTFPPPLWTVPELLPAGLASLAGRPKLGKSWLALQLAVAVASGGRFLDAKVEGGPVLYLALEDSPRRLKARLERLKAPTGLRLRFETDWPPLNGNAGGLMDLERRVEKVKPRLVVVDTLARAFSGRVDWNDLGSTTGAMADLQGLAMGNELCILCVDHHRKSGPLLDDVIDDMIGSTGKSAVVDTAWGLYRKRGEHAATLRVVGRDVDEKELAVEFEAQTSCWQLLGDARKVAADAAQAEVLDALETLGEADAGAVAREVGVVRSTARKHLERLCGSGQVDSKLMNVNGTRKVVFFLKEAE
jgi:hypothetical protein